jgi:hypothetical protein
MSLAFQIDSRDAAQVAPTFTLRPKPDRRQAPRVIVEPGTSLECYIRTERQPAYVAGAQILGLDRRGALAVL